MPVDVAAIGCDFYAFSGHKLYGPTGIGVPVGPRRAAQLDAAMAGRRRDDRQRHVRARRPIAPPPQRFEAGTPHIVGAVGLHAAVDWVESIGSTRSTRTNARWSPSAATALSAIPGVTLYGPEDSAGIVSFNVEGCIRTTSPPYWTMRASRSAPATIARSR